MADRYPHVFGPGGQCTHCGCWSVDDHHDLECHARLRAEVDRLNARLLDEAHRTHNETVLLVAAGNNALQRGNGGTRG